MSDDKYKAACIEYAAASRAVKDIQAAIGKYLNDCRVAAVNEWIAANPKASEWDAPANQWQKSPHLQAGYAMEADPYNHGGHYYINHDDDVEGYLAETCDHCLKAHQAIQSKKAAKARFGIAKRRISVLGAPAK